MSDSFGSKKATCDGCMGCNKSHNSDSKRYLEQQQNDVGDAEGRIHSVHQRRRLYMVPPTNAPSVSQTDSPTLAPTTAPTSIAEQDEIGTVFFLTYLENVEDALSLTLSIYAQELTYAIMHTLVDVSRDDSGWLAVCGDDGSNTTASEAIASFCHNKYEPPTTDDDDRRRLQEKTSLEINTADDYSFGVENGTITWWKGRITGFRLCLVLNLVWNPGTCTDDLSFDYILDKIQNEGVENEYLAVGTFFTAADYGELEYQTYIADKFEQSPFVQNLTNFIQNNNWAMLVPEGFVAEQIFLGDARPESRVDTFGTTSVDIMIGVYGFLILCIVAAIAAAVHGCRHRADNVSSFEPVKIS